MPTNIYDPGAGALGGRVYLVGGGNPARQEIDNAFDTTYAYDPATDSWETGPNLNTARAFTAAATSLLRPAPPRDVAHCTRMAATIGPNDVDLYESPLPDLLHRATGITPVDAGGHVILADLGVQSAQRARDR